MILNGRATNFVLENVSNIRIRHRDVVSFQNRKGEFKAEV
jgi:hypothetical protein